MIPKSTVPRETAALKVVSEPKCFTEAVTRLRRTVGLRKRRRREQSTRISHMHEMRRGMPSGVNVRIKVYGVPRSPA